MRDSDFTVTSYVIILTWLFSDTVLVVTIENYYVYNENEIIKILKFRIVIAYSRGKVILIKLIITIRHI